MVGLVGEVDEKSPPGSLISACHLVAHEALRADLDRRIAAGENIGVRNVRQRVAIETKSLLPPD